MNVVVAVFRSAGGYPCTNIFFSSNGFGESDVPQVYRGPIGVVFFFCFLFPTDFNVHQNGWILGRFSDGHGAVFLLPGRLAGIMCTVIEKIFILMGNGSFFSTRMFFS